MSRLKDSLDVFFHYRPLLRHLVMRDIRVKYRRSALGVAWSVLNPLLMMTVQVIVFTNLFENKFDNKFEFAVYLLCGQVMFNFFSEATNLGLDSVLGGAGLIKKVYIPKYIFPLEKVIFSLVNVVFSYIALFGVILVTGWGLSPLAFLFPLPLAIMFLFNFGVGLILAAGTVFFRDIKHFYGVFVMALTYFTPIFYPEEILLDGRSPVVIFFAKANPLYWFVKLNRSILYTKELPDAALILTPLAWAVGLVFVGLLVFKKTQDKFILHI